MNKTLKILISSLIITLILSLGVIPAFADEDSSADNNEESIIQNLEDAVDNSGTEGASIDEFIAEDITDEDGAVIGYRITITFTDGREDVSFDIYHGEDGKAIVPEFKVEEGTLYITYDVDKEAADKTWTEIGKVQIDTVDEVTVLLIGTVALIAVILASISLLSSGRVYRKPWWML